MPDIDSFLAKQRKILEENEKRTQVVFDEFLAGIKSSQDLVDIWKHSFSKEQGRQLFRVFREFLEVESASANSQEELWAIWGPIWNLPFFEGPFYLPDLMGIYYKRKHELERR